MTASGGLIFHGRMQIVQRFSLGALVLFTLTACGGGGGAALPAADSATRATHGTAAQQTGVWGQVVHAVPNALALTCRGSADFDAMENFEGNVTAALDGPPIATVSPADQRNHVDPTDGGLKHAWFTVTGTGTADGVTQIVVTDKKGNADLVTVTVTGCIPPRAPTPLGTPFPGFTPGPVSGIH